MTLSQRALLAPQRHRRLILLFFGDLLSRVGC